MLPVDNGAESIADRLADLLGERAAFGLSVQDFLGKQFDLGLAWVHFDVGAGGLAAPASLQGGIDQEILSAGAPVAFHHNALGVGMVAPTIHAHGTSEQRRMLRPLFAAEEIWCQLFSEPSAGSDLASIATRAVRDGNGWRVDGQKVWTSYAHAAKWGLLLARTEPNVPKHRGLTCFLLDMHAPGVDVRPLYQMTGEAEFNEVFIVDVFVPDELRIGDVGLGWQVAMTTLANERRAIGGQVQPRNDGLIGEALKRWVSRPGGPVQRDRLMQLWIEAEVLRLLNHRAAAGRALDDPGPEGSVSKILSARLNMEISEFIIHQLGPDGALKPDGYPLARSNRNAFEFGHPQHDFLRARANPIEGGTSEIGKTVIGQRLLGLPAEPRVDKDVPWTDVPR